MRARSSFFPGRHAGALIAVAALSCGRSGPTREKAAGVSDRGVVTVERAAARSGPSGKSPVIATLVRGAEVRVLEGKDGFFKVSRSRGEDVWLESDTFERSSDRAAREKRAGEVSGFALERGRAVESCPVLLAPAYGSARWGELEDGDDVEVLLADHDFYGVRLPGRVLGFVPARSVRLLPSAATNVTLPDPAVAAAARSRAEIARRQTDRDEHSADRSDGEPEANGSQEPLVSLPAGAEPPQLMSRIEPRYPEIARRTGVGGDVVLRVVVEPNGRVGRVEIVSGAPFGLTASAVDAVGRWIYRPARIAGRPVAVWKVVRVRFSVSG
ncbi:MAG: TonB family protein [Thermoanaerobaculia bacterium]